MSKETETASDLLNFNWDSNETFFDVNENGTEATPAKPVVPKKDKEEKSESETNNTDEDEEESQEVDNFFDEVENQDAPDNIGGQSNSNTNSYNDYFKDLKEAGIFKHVELDENEEIDADKLFELQEEDYELEMASRLEKWASQDLDPDAQAFIRFKTQGGSTQDFFKTYSSTSSFQLGDIEDEDYQDEIIRHSLINEDWDSEEIEERLETLTASGKKAKIAEKYHNRLETTQQQEKQQLVELAARQKEAAKEQEDQFKDSIKTALETSTEVKGLKITPKDKTDILNFLTKKNHKVDDQRSITGFQKGLSEIFKDNSKVILLAKLIQNDFDFSGIEKSAVTKKTKEVKRNIEQRQSARPFGSGSSSTGSGLASLFDK